MMPRTDLTEPPIPTSDARAPDRWLLVPAAASEAALPVSLADVGALLEQVGRAGSDAVAGQLLQLLGRHVALAQCTIFLFQGRSRPRIAGLGDRARTGALPMISDSYSRRFYRLDGAQRVMAEELERMRRDPQARPRVWLHRQQPADVAHAEYRHLCYALPRLVERLSLLGQQQGEHWIAVNLYRGEEHGRFDAPSIARIEAFAPLVMQAMRLHCAGQSLHDDLAGLVLDRLSRRFGQLTQRDLDVVRAVIEGLPTDALAARLGITVASARTYVKRVCAKLGVQGQRELFALLMEPAAPH